ncbi:hypothetical protein KUTeg_002018 [Tegillarca granosa]|uniref:Transporter n=1 Tax=Tegillarca granosa TaxID=220873 RepID=A0ABQ9FUJ6_TEGGR|nr:hypothetical protein KUTeg_002018 [Tegillarca granosa]
MHCHEHIQDARWRIIADLEGTGLTIWSFYSPVLVIWLVWRFPYVCYRNGGGAFLIPYFFFLFVAGLPLTLLEISYCQYSNLGPAKVWECCPLFRGIGYGMVVFISIVAIYYNVIISWCLYYFGNSFFPKLPWASCDNIWNTDACYERFGNTTKSTSIWKTGPVSTQFGNITNKTLFNNMTSTYNFNFNGIHNSSMLNMSLIVTKTSSEEFWEYHVLELTEGIERIGMVRWQLLLCSFITLAVTFLCLFKGIKTSGKVAYLAASLPYLFLVILLVRGATLPGALDGLKFYLIPRWSDLKRFSVWGDAAVQALFSIGIGTANIQTLASYNNFNYDCHSYKKSTRRPGIAFMVYPEALSTLPLPQFWCALFFLMLFMVGLDSQIVHIQVMCSAITDNWPKMLRWTTSLTVLVCLSQFILGIPFVTQGGVYIVQLIDWS